MREPETNLWGAMHPRSCVHFKVSKYRAATSKSRMIRLFVHEACGKESGNILQQFQTGSYNCQPEGSCFLCALVHDHNQSR